MQSSKYFYILVFTKCSILPKYCFRFTFDFIVKSILLSLVRVLILGTFVKRCLRLWPLPCFNEHWSPQCLTLWQCLTFLQFSEIFRLVAKCGEGLLQCFTHYSTHHLEQAEEWKIACRKDFVRGTRRTASE